MARNKKLADKYRGQPCIVCGQAGEGDHIKNYAGNPDRDNEFNMWALCRAHHIEKGYSLARFVERYRLWEEMKSRGFYWDGTNRKYRHEKL